MELTQEEATTIARSVVVALCGSRWVSPPVRMTDEYPIPESGQVILSGRPVQAVHSVRVDGKALVEGDWRVSNGFILDLYARRALTPSICRSGRMVEIDYTYGQANLPDVVERAIDTMTQELLAASNNDASCRIPERVTSVTRQGVSWTMLDPQDFLEEGRTGIYEVDLAIKAVNPTGARRRARVFTATMSAPAIRRIS